MYLYPRQRGALRCLWPQAVHHDMVWICYRPLANVATKCLFQLNCQSLLVPTKFSLEPSNYCPHLFLPIDLVHGRQRLPPFNQRNQFHRNIRVRHIHTLHPRRPICSRQTHILFWRVNSKFKYTRMKGLERDWIDVEEKNAHCMWNKFSTSIDSIEMPTTHLMQKWKTRKARKSLMLVSRRRWSCCRSVRGV